MKGYCKSNVLLSIHLVKYKFPIQRITETAKQVGTRLNASLVVIWWKVDTNTYRYGLAENIHNLHQSSRIAWIPYSSISRHHVYVQSEEA